MGPPPPGPPRAPGAPPRGAPWGPPPWAPPPPRGGGGGAATTQTTPGRPSAASLCIRLFPKSPHDLVMQARSLHGHGNPRAADRKARGDMYLLEDVSGETLDLFLDAVATCICWGMSQAKRLICFCFGT